MIQGLPWEAVLGGIVILLSLFGFLIRIDRRISKLWALFDINNREHVEMRKGLRRHKRRLDDHESRISTLEGQAESN
jgi:hypothetical protein